MRNKIEDETSAEYLSGSKSKDEQRIINEAINILVNRMQKLEDVFFTSADTVKKYLILNHSERESEIFGCLFLNTRHQLIEDQILFYGTIDGCSIHPREVVKAALMANAAAVIIYHNHPSDNTTPSNTDLAMTKRLKDSLGLMDIPVLDHIIIGKTGTYSFADDGRL